MALVVVCGQPCSGKTRAADALAAALRAACPAPPRLHLLADARLHLPDRNANHRDAASEKVLRGALRSEADRAVSRDTIVIVDSLNAIKGYRYELWCLARAAGVRYCLVHCDVPAEVARTWNEARRQRGEPHYHTDILEDLTRRFERPDGRNRWDSPLFEIQPDKGEDANESAVIARVVEFLTSDKDDHRVRELQPTIATQTALLSETNRKYEVDQAAQDPNFWSAAGGVAEASEVIPEVGRPIDSVWSRLAFKCHGGQVHVR
eukprot:SM000234S07900  [mRNA]  locus=s234:200854:203013:+ [translate_table: standard]